MTNTATKGAQTLADLEGIDIQSIGTNNRVSKAEVQDAIDLRDEAKADAAPAKKKAAPKAAAPKVDASTIVYLGMGNSAQTVAYGVSKVQDANPGATVIVQCRAEITGDGIECHVLSVSKFIKEHAVSFDSCRIAVNGAVQGDPDRIRNGLKSAYRPQDES